VRHGNRGGLAGAYNVALNHVFSLIPEARHVVFVDEDSDIGTLSAFIEHGGTCGAMSADSVAVVAPAHRDRRSGMRATHMVLDRYWFKRLPRDVRGVVAVAFVINSMSLWSLAALRRIGPYDEELAIDQVDIDYCLRARLRGYEVCLNGDCEFDHAVGRRRVYVFVGRQFQAGGHSPARRYLIGRNTVWLAKRYLRTYPAFAVICLLRLVHEGLGIAMAETDKLAKLKRLAKGALVGGATADPPIGEWPV
jgi:rhamnosyltransferase